MLIGRVNRVRLRKICLPKFEAKIGFGTSEKRPSKVQVTLHANERPPRSRRDALARVLGRRVLRRQCVRAERQRRGLPPQPSCKEGMLALQLCGVT